MTTPKPLPTGQIVDGRFRIEAPLGAGGHGHVYRAVQLSVRRPVALKVLRSRLAMDRTSTMAERFQKEARYACKLSHSNTVVYYDFGNDKTLGILYVVMELLTGSSVEEDLRAHGPMELLRAVSIVEQVCHALGEAHAIGLIHRDIKPSNIMLTQRAGLSDFVKIIDFGIAKAVEPILDEDDESLTAEGVVLGSPHYIPPEQLRGSQNIDQRADIYALGCTLYKMLTGVPPFRGTTPVDIATQHLYNTPSPMSAMLTNRDFPQPLENLIAQALAKDPNARPSTTITFAEMLGDAIKDNSAAHSVRRAAPTLIQQPSIPTNTPTQTPRPRRSTQLANTFVEGDVPSTKRNSGSKTSLLAGAMIALGLLVIGGLGLIALKNNKTAPETTTKTQPKPQKSTTALDVRDANSAPLDVVTTTIDSTTLDDTNKVVSADEVDVATEHDTSKDQPTPSLMRVTIAVKPWGTVVVGGQRGDSPLQVRLKPGRHRVMIQQRERKTFRAIHVRQGKTSYILNVPIQ